MILHCAVADKFIQPFIDFVEKNFEFDRHFFLVKKNDQYFVKERNNVFLVDLDASRITRAFLYIRSLHKAEKIFVHGLFDSGLLWMLALQPWLLKRCYWIMWGGDLYSLLNNRRWNLRDRVKAFVIKRMGNFVTQVPGDYQLAQERFDADGLYWDSFVYPSNLYQETSLVGAMSDGALINILLGNSADPSNEHLWALERIHSLCKENIVVYCPLSYGDMVYAKRIVSAGRNLLGERFVPLFSFLPFSEYIILLNKIDIAVFAHRRQQAMGNITTLLGMGKKVYMRTSITSWAMFKNIGVEVYDVENIDIKPIEDIVACRNEMLIKKHFSEKNLILQLEKIFK